MKFLFFLICSLSVLFFCHAAIKKKYISSTSDDFFSQRYESDFLPRWPTTDRTAEGLGRLTTSLLNDINARAGRGFNIILSPISIWSMLAMLFEGSGGQTEVELGSKLQIPFLTAQEGREVLRGLYQQLKHSIKGKNSPTEFTSLNFIVSDKSKPVNPLYRNIVKQLYDGEAFDIDSSNVNREAMSINYWARDASGFRIRTIVTPTILNNLALVIGNAVYFKSKWKYPFDVTETVYEPFKDENGRILTSVPTMKQFLVLPHSYNLMLDSQVVEIPYSDGVTSMIVILPREGLGLSGVLSRMTYLDLETILPRNMTEEGVQLSLPKFNVVSKMNLNDVLKQDIPSVFDRQSAEFPYIGKDVYVSKITHRAEIQNTEEGTTASAISSAQFSYKSSGVEFQANRPFIYFITEINTRTILFAGTYSNPYST